MNYLSKGMLMINSKTAYTDERNAQILIALLKAHGIKRVIASPGTSHMPFLGSIQSDPWFKIWSAIDERHAAFLAVGMATEIEEPVVITCTGSTASRNYLPALTEAYYRQVPVLAVTAAQRKAYSGQLRPQYINRSTPPVDAIKYDCYCPTVMTAQQAEECELAINAAILELKHQGGGPVHIDLEVSYSKNFSVKELPSVRKIERYLPGDALPDIPATARIAVYIGTHKRFKKNEVIALERFLNSHNAIAVCHATSSWHGAKKVVSALICSQGISGNPKYVGLKPDLIIDIGGVANDYSAGYFQKIAPVWRVAEDGVIRDRFGSLQNVFEMQEADFFEKYANDSIADTSFADEWKAAYLNLIQQMPELPFSNLWIGQQLIPRISEQDVLFIGVSSTLQNWATFLQTTNVWTMSNVGTCGIDGCVSTFLGASLSNQDRLHYCVVGDLTFFYDLNSLGNRHIGKNVRLIVVNNGCASLFHSPKHLLEPFTGALDEYFAAKGHFGDRSPTLLKHYATDLGFEYLSASSKDEFLSHLPYFTSKNLEKSIVLECFTTVEDDCAAWSARKNIDCYEPRKSFSSEVKQILPGRIKNAIKELVK